MDSLRGYVEKVSKIVSSVMEEADNVLNVKPEDAASQVTGDAPHAVDGNEANSTNGSEVVTITSDTEIKPVDTGLFGWFPGFQSSAEHYLNSLASLGDPPVIDNPVEDAAPEVVTEEPVNDVKSRSETNSESANVEEEDTLQNSLPSWLSSVSSRGEEVWRHIRQDFSEVMATMSKERKEMAATIYQHISAATAEASNKVDLSNFHLLPENKPKEGHGDTTSGDASDVAEFPTLSDLRDDVKKLVNDFVSNLFGSDTPRMVSGTVRREARLQILRADPATYEVEPALPPEHLHLHNYADWRTAYFDEATCQPLPGIPLFPHGSEELANALHREQVKEAVQVMEPGHPSPEELLDAHPFMRTYLTQLVGDFPGALTDGDFWSRYYYRVWLMDVTEARRQLLTTRLAGKQAAQDGEPLTSPEATDWQDDSDEEQATASKSTQPPPPTSAATSLIPLLDQEQQTGSSLSPSERVQETRAAAAAAKPPKAKSSAAAGAKQRRRARKASERGEKSQAANEVDATGNPLTSEDTAAVLSVEETACRPPAQQQQTCESDGSSSIVVLGNSDDEVVATAAVPPAVGEATCRQYATTEAVVHSSAQPSDEWTHVGEDEATAPGIGCLDSGKLREPKANQDKSEADDWEDWS